MIVLKHLAREFNLEPYKLRQILRKQFGKSMKEGTYRKWKWKSNDDPELNMIRSFLRTGECTSPLPVNSIPDTVSSSTSTPSVLVSASKINGESLPMMTKRPSSKLSKALH